MATLALCVSAQEPATNPTPSLPPVVVTGTRIPIELDKSPTATSIITAEDIEQKQARTVADILRDQAGVDISRTGQPGGQTTLFMRGANGGHTLVLIDGVRVNRPFDNTFNFADLSTDNIERIEILRGPQSTIYGSEAMGGVINIVTKTGGTKPSGSALLEGGSYQSLRTRESFAARYGKLSLAVSGSYFTTENARPNSDYRLWSLSARAGYEFSEQFKVSLLTTYSKSDAGAPNDRLTNDPNDFIKNESKLFALTFEAQPTPWWNSKLTLAHAHERGFFSNLEPNPPFFFGDYTALTLSDRNQVDFQNTFTLGEQHKFLLGGAYDDSSVKYTDTFGAIDSAISDKSVFAQYQYSPHERFTATAGGRIDDHSTFGAKPTGRFGARFTTPGTETILRANIGTGFRAPSIADLYYPGFSNPGLKPEESLGWDAGAEQSFADGKVQVGVTYFQNEFRNLITYPFPTPINVGRAKTLGLETFASWTPLPDLSLRATYTWLTTENVATGNRLPRRPEHNATLEVNYRFCTRFSTFARAKLISSRLDTAPLVFTPASNGGYIKCDLGLAYDVCKNFSLHGRVENLLGDKFEEVLGFPSLGRVFWLGATAKF